MSLVKKGTLQGLLSPQPRIYALSGDFSSGSPLKLFDGKALEIAGSCVMYDPTDAVLGTLEIALDSRSRSGVEFFTLSPGVILDFRDGQYNNIYLRFTPATFSVATGNTYLGRIIFAPSMQGDNSGAMISAPTYVRDVPAYSETFNAIVGVTGTRNWLANPTGTGIFTLTLVINAFNGGSSASGIQAYLDNNGTESIFISTSITNLTNPADPFSTSACFELEANKDITIRNVFLPNTPRNVQPVTNPLIGVVAPIRLFGAVAPQVRAVVTTYF